MPYSIKKNYKKCSGWAVVKDGDGKQMGCHSTRKKAVSQIAALNASEGSGGYKEHQDTYKPTSGMVSAAKRGLKLREEQTPSNRGGTSVGLARARDIVSGKNLSESTVKRMYSFFSRHEVDKRAEGFRAGEDGYPSRGLQAWLLWGGDPGYSWSSKIVKHLKASEKGARAQDGYATREAARERAREIGCSGAHQMEDGLVWMPCSSHAAYERVTGRNRTGYKDDQFGPSGRIFLQDLNVALSSNFGELKNNRPMANFVENVEQYRKWLVDMLKHEHVILVTARSVKYEELTLNRINDQTGWQPTNWYFNPWHEDEKAVLRAHKAKERYLKEFIFPRYGEDPAKYFAIESNKYTRAMYRSHGIECRDANRDDSQPWKSLLP